MMFVQREWVRFIRNAASVCYSTDKKSLLGKLRKKTGYSFSNCKKALEMHDNNLEMAEKWLHDQAQTLGWSKATKLGGRKTSEGLVAVMVNKGHAAMVELNCETDFVSRNKQFQTLVELVAKTCLGAIPETCTKAEPLNKVFLNTESLSVLAGPDGKTLADHVALTIGLVGENMVLKRAALLNAEDGIHLSGYSHPAPASKSNPMLGKYGSILAFRQKSGDQISGNKTEIARQLCQHIVGMNPIKIGDPIQDKPCERVDDESCMIYQEFLLDPAVTVGEVLNCEDLEVIDFVRFECGETVEKPDSEGENILAQVKI